jgi:CRISPR-associated protein Cas1
VGGDAGDQRRRGRTRNAARSRQERRDVLSRRFCFLGEDFGPRYPPALDDYRSIEPPRRVLYVAVQGSHVRVAAGRVVVESAQDQELLNAPSGQLERVVPFGAVGLSAGARSWALANAVDLVFLSRRGSYLGHGWAAASKTRVTRPRAQLAASGDAARAVVFARAVVEAKIRKQIVLLQRFGRRDTAEAVADAASRCGSCSCSCRMRPPGRS